MISENSKSTPRSPAESYVVWVDEKTIHAYSKGRFAKQNWLERFNEIVTELSSHPQGLLAPVFDGKDAFTLLQRIYKNDTNIQHLIQQASLSLILKGYNPLIAKENILTSSEKVVVDIAKLLVIAEATHGLKLRDENGGNILHLLSETPQSSIMTHWLIHKYKYGQEATIIPSWITEKRFSDGASFAHVLWRNTDAATINETWYYLQGSWKAREVIPFTHIEDNQGITVAQVIKQAIDEGVKITKDAEKLYFEVEDTLLHINTAQARKNTSKANRL